jgi:uncharacterized protein (DUF433 family)
MRSIAQPLIPAQNAFSSSRCVVRVRIRRSVLVDRPPLRYPCIKMKKPVELGKYIVADPQICHGAVTFRGTRLLVADALELLVEGLSPVEVCKQMHGWIVPDAVAEAVRLANDGLF